MRGGAIPVFLWGTGLLVLFAINAIWTRDKIQMEMFGFAVLVVYVAAAAFWRLNREAAHKGAPRPRDKLEAAPSTSLAAMLVGIAIGAMLVGSVFGKFLVYMGGGLWVLAFGRLLIEVRAQRRFLRRMSGERER
jgi:hypothetical protein